MKNFDAKRIARTYALDVAGKPQQIFPLLCPVREYEWIDGWKCDLIYSASGVAEEDCVFTTTDWPPVPQYTIWVTTRSDAEHYRREFILMTPGLMVLHMRFKVEGIGENMSRLSLALTLTALTEEGNTHIEKLAADDYKLLDFEAHGMVGLLDHFMRTGARLERKDWHV